MFTRRRIASVLALLTLVVVLVSCAKRPATTAASAPAPTGVAGSTGPSRGPSEGASSAPAAVQPGGTGGGSGTPTPSGGSTAGGARPVPREFAAIADLRDIFFDFDKYDVRPSEAKTLEANAAWLKSHENMLVLVEGHCDERGTNEYNLALGERRAKATMNYLVAQGVQANRITIISYGEERPVCSEHTEACWAKNRRGHFLVKPR